MTAAVQHSTVRNKPVPASSSSTSAEHLGSDAALEKVRNAAVVLRDLEDRLRALNSSTQVVEPRRVSFSGGGETVVEVVVGTRKPR